MFRQYIALGMVFLIISAHCTAAAAERAVGQVTGDGTGSLKEQIVQLPAGTVVEVKFLRKGEKNLVGRLGPVADSGFEVQAAKDGNVSSEKLVFTDVKSVKVKGKMHPAVKGAIIGGVAVGVLFAVFGIIVASGGID